ncbi:hypothetical protein ACSLOK_26440, partial [Escherichia coli]|uniref:DUF968 domain-containing protein n=1 Tax=Escherichia coli TaxID=562 RepID=UPI003EDEB609
SLSRYTEQIFSAGNPSERRDTASGSASTTRLQTATSILKQRTKNLAPLPYAHQQQKPPQEKTVVSITVDPESPESFMKLPKRRRWVKEKYT